MCVCVCVCGRGCIHGSPSLLPSEWEGARWQFSTTFVVLDLLTRLNSHQFHQESRTVQEARTQTVVAQAPIIRRLLTHSDRTAPAVLWGVSLIGHCANGLWGRGLPFSRLIGGRYTWESGVIAIAAIWYYLIPADAIVKVGIGFIGLARKCARGSSAYEMATLWSLS